MKDCLLAPNIVTHTNIITKVFAAGTSFIKASTLLFLILFAFANKKTNAQIRLFVTGGPQSATIQQRNASEIYLTETAPFLKARTAAKIGINAVIPFHENSRWSLQPGVFYSGKGNIFEKQFDTTGGQSPFYYKKSITQSDYIDIPVQIGYKFPISTKTSFYVSAGPMISVFYTSKTLEDIYVSDNSSIRVESVETKGETGEAAGNFKSAYGGVSASAGFDFGGVMVQGNYTKGIQEFGVSSSSEKFYHQTIGATLSFRIASQKDKPRVKTPPKVKDTVAIFRPGKTITPAVTAPPLPVKKPNTPKKKYILTDSDGDGVPDIFDACPTVPGKAMHKGCPIPDTDGDGINDAEDECMLEVGPRENKGCPIKVQEETVKKVEQIAAKIQFEFGRTEIDKTYFKLLDEIADLLLEDEQLKISIEGHTDNIGSAERNKTVSQQRADVIKEYLVNKGISGERIKAIGYGSDRAISDNTTNEGRKANRRVEFHLNY